ncbi:MAG: DUF1285 domain-containing protein, partial [Pseudomonadales bacterium]|nr:DUF1285 domain-containing protein [Pseudomonadales bacterium]
EGEDYFLVTPAEKWKIQVEDVPFLIVKADFFSGESSFIQFVTNVGDVFTLDREHPLHMVENGFKEVIPYVLVRNNLEARVSRPVYYDLVSKAEERVDQAAKYVYISSAGESFDLGEIPE